MPPWAGRPSPLWRGRGGAAFAGRSRPWSLLLAGRRRRRAASACGAACSGAERGSRPFGPLQRWRASSAQRSDRAAAHARGKGLKTCARGAYKPRGACGAKLSRVSRDASPELGIDLCYGTGRMGRGPRPSRRRRRAGGGGVTRALSRSARFTVTISTPRKRARRLSATRRIKSHEKKRSKKKSRRNLRPGQRT